MTPAFLRPANLAPAALAVALFAWLVPINHGPVGTAVVLLIAWLGFSAAVHATRDLVALVRELRSGSPRRPPMPAVPVAPQTASAESSPPLDARDEQAVREIVALLATAGVFAPSAPPPERLFEAAADLGTPVTQRTVLGALHEARYHHPTFDASACMANLAFHGSHNEQDESTLRDQIDDIVRLAAGALAVRVEKLSLPRGSGAGSVRECRIKLTVNGAPLSLRYAHAAKYLSTHLHVELAVALRNMGAARRLAWLWDDQGVWLTSLSDTALARLNDGPGITADGDAGWEWIDDAEPIAAGEDLDA